MKKSARKASTKRASAKKAATPKKHPLHKEVPTLNAFVIIFYILIAILFIGLYFTKMSQ